jgi:predicted nucleic acid-binding protein
VRYWDTSALVPTVLEQPESERMRALGDADPAIATWWGTTVECVSALSRNVREGKLVPDQFAGSLAELRKLSASWTTLWPSDEIREQAIRLVRVHPLRAADAIHMAAALVASEYQPSLVEFVTLDRRQADAADKEGFRVVG